MTRYVIVGYFGRENLGDDQYLYSVPYVLHRIGAKPHAHLCINIEELQLTEIYDSDIVIFGGGDIINAYFLDQLWLRFLGKKTRPKIIGFSIGIPFISAIDHQGFELIDHIFLRTNQDRWLLDHYPGKFSFVCDTALLFPWPKDPPQLNFPYMVFNVHAFYDKNLYHEKMARFIDSQSIKVVLLPFCTNQSEGDHDKYNDIVTKLKRPDNVINIGKNATVFERLNILRHAKKAVVMRFHGAVFCSYFGVPCCPVTTTRKMTNFILDTTQTKPYPLETFFDQPVTDDMYKQLKCDAFVQDGLDTYIRVFTEIIPIE